MMISQILNEKWVGDEIHVQRTPLNFTFINRKKSYYGKEKGEWWTKKQLDWKFKNHTKFSNLSIVPLAGNQRKKIKISCMTKSVLLITVTTQSELAIKNNLASEEWDLWNFIQTQFFMKRKFIKDKL